jgi:hypothetical protein
MKKNPAPKKIYTLRNIEIRGIKMNIKIKSLTPEEQKVEVDCKNKISKKDLEYIKNYLIMEGFNEEATKYNYEN